MIQGIRNNPATYQHPFSTTSSVGSAVSVRRIEKFETRLDQTEQSNRALLDELMRIQTDMKVASKRHQQRLDEEKRAREQLDAALRTALGRLTEAEQRARRAEQSMTETKTTLTQLATHTKNVERAIGSSQQSLTARKDASGQQLTEIQRSMGQLEKNAQNLRNEMQDLKNKMGQQTIINSSLSKPNSDVSIAGLQTIVQEVQSKLKAEEQSREQLQQQVNKRNLNEIENSVNKNNEDVVQRMAKMETTVREMDERVKKTTTEMEKVLAAEILARRDQGKLLKSKMYECNDNLRAGLASVQGKKLPKGLTSDVNWKLDAVKVHQISEEAAEQVRQDLEKQIKELQKKQKMLEEPGRKNVSPQTIKKEVATTPARPSSTSRETEKISKKEPAIVGGSLDQNLDQILFTQEKLKWQTNHLQEELNRVTGDQKPGSLEDRLALVERRLTARMDAESRNTNKNVIILKDDLDLLKSRVTREASTARRSPGSGKKSATKPDEKLDKDSKTAPMPILVGSETDQRLDQLSFGQEKLRSQNAQMQQDLDELTRGSKSENLEDRLTDLDRKVTARMDAETRNRNKDVKLLKDDIELLKKREAVKQQNTAPEDVKVLKKEIADTKTGFRKLAESVQVVKTTLGDKLQEETRIRKQETGRLQTDVAKVKTWIQKNQ